MSNIIPSATSPAGSGEIASQGFGELLRAALRRVDHGQNRHREQTLFEAGVTDLHAIELWLNRYRGATYAAYRKEALRLLSWGLLFDPDKTEWRPEGGWQFRGPKLPSAFTLADVGDYMAFLKAPTPARDWCGPPVSLHHPAWRPFQRGQSVKSRNYTRTVLKSMFATLKELGYFKHNPFAAERKETPAHTDERGRYHATGAGRSGPIDVSRRFSEAEWTLIRRALTAMPSDTPYRAYKKERAVFLVNLLYRTGVRREEVVTAQMKNILRDEQTGYWFWEVFGKGGKVRNVPVTGRTWQIIVRWRKFLGLPPYPAPDETIPLLPSRRGQPLNRKTVYGIVKEVVTRASELAEDERTRARLNRASTHWLRHTWASDALNKRQRNIVTVRDVLGHTNIATTNSYLDADDHRNYREIQETDDYE